MNVIYYQITYRSRSHECDLLPDEPGNGDMQNNTLQYQHIVPKYAAHKTPFQAQTEKKTNENELNFSSKHLQLTKSVFFVYPRNHAYTCKQLIWTCLVQHEFACL